MSAAENRGKPKAKARGPGAAAANKVHLSQPLQPEEITDYQLVNFQYNVEDYDPDSELHPLYREYLRILDDVLPVYENVLQY